VEIDAPAEEYVQFADFRRDPARHPLKTPSGKIEIFSETIAGFDYDDCPGHATWLEPKEWLGSPLTDQFPLHMLSTQPSTRLHGQLDNGPVSRATKISGREPIYMNTADAEARRIRSGDVVKVFNDRGACLAGAIVTDGIVAGVVEFPTGAWYDPEAAGTIGSLDKHGNPNVLTRDEGTSRLGQGPSAQSALVEIEIWQGPLPAISAFDVPDVVQS
jgi:biotin/methionine sulfoxide reductase